jgi:predicted ArsR family transcriptional regulator
MSDYYSDSVADLPLFAPRAPSVNGSTTSAAAADSLDVDALNALQRRVLSLLQATPGGLTDEEMQRRLGMNPSTQRPRRIELARRGFVVADGTRKTSSGRWAVVWRVTA